MNLARDVKNNKKGFKKRKNRESIGSIAQRDRGPAYTWHGKTKVLNVLFVSVFTSKTVHQQSQVSDTMEKVWGKEDAPLVEEDQVRESLSNPWDLMGCTQKC